MPSAVEKVFTEAIYQRCVILFYRKVFSALLKSKVKLVSKMLKAIYYQESKEADREKAEAVICELKAMKLKKAGKMIEY